MVSISDVVMVIVLVMLSCVVLVGVCVCGSSVMYIV